MLGTGVGFNKFISESPLYAVRGANYCIRIDKGENTRVVWELD